MNELLKKAKEVAGRVKDVTGEKVGQAKEFFGDVSEVVKLEWEIAECKNNLNKLLFEYGKACYYEEESSEEEKAQLKSEIIELEAVINMLEASVRKIKEEAEKKAAENEEKQKEVEKNVVYCTNCGKKFNAKEKFCSKCGNKLTK